MEEIKNHVLKRFWIVKYGVLIAILGPIVDLMDLYLNIKIVSPTINPGRMWIRALFLLAGGLFCISIGKKLDVGTSASRSLFFAGFGFIAVALVKFSLAGDDLFLVRSLGDFAATVLFALAFFEALKVRKTN